MHNRISADAPDELKSLEELKRGPAFFIQGDNLPIDDGILNIQRRDRIHHLR